MAFALVVLAACNPPQIQRPLEGAPVGTQTASGDRAASGAPPLSEVPPTLSPINSSAAGTPTPGVGPGGSPSPLPLPSPSPEPGYTIVATDGRGANLREGPGTSSRVITTLAEGTPVELFPDEATVNGQAWRRIRSGNREGWVVAPVVRRR